MDIRLRPIREDELEMVRVVNQDPGSRAARGRASAA
jgi:hypothetical protein